MIIFEASGSDVIIRGRHSNGDRYQERRKYRPYFYVKGDGPYKSLFGDKLKKIEVTHPANVKQEKHKYPQSFESDVTYINRYMIDCIPELPKEPIRCAFLDIEVDDADGYPNLETADKPIISICIYDSFKEKYHVFALMPETGDERVEKYGDTNFYYFNTEENLLNQVVRFVEIYDFDLFWAWNGDSFDYPYLFKRQGNPSLFSPMHDVDTRSGLPRGRVWMDLMWSYDKMMTTELESKGLDYVAKLEGLGGKIQHEGKVGELWRKDFQKFIDYNKHDVELMVQIEKKRGVLNYFDGVRRMTYSYWYDIRHNSRVLDFFMLKKAHQKGIVLPAMANVIESEKIEGARVISPKPGLHEMVAGVDVRSLYPSAIMLGNMSPETVDQQGDITIGPARFSTKVRGFVPQVVEELWEYRQSIKKEMKTHEIGSNEYVRLDELQTVAKFLLNSVYGILLYPRSRIYLRALGAAVTYFGRTFNEYMERVALSFGVEVIAGDSVAHDSLIVVNGKNVEISSLFKEVSYTDGDKEYCNLENVFTDTIDNNGKALLGKVKYIMRHKCNKKMYRVYVSNEQFVDVTEDHSLIGFVNSNKLKKYGSRLIEIKPTELKGDIKSVITKRQSLRIEEKQYATYPLCIYELYGYFVGNGCFDLDKQGNNHNLMIATGNDEECLIELFNRVIATGYADRWYKKNEKGDYRLYGNITNCVSKNIENWLFSEPIECIQAFIRGLFSADGSVMIRNNNPIIRFSNINIDISKKVIELLKFCSINASIFKGNNVNCYNGKCSNTFNYYVAIKDKMAYKQTIGFLQTRKMERLENTLPDEQYSYSPVIKIEEIEYNDYVYDIEVENTHKFFANNICVHNTDSLYFKVTSVEQAQEIADAINNGIPEFIKANFGDDKYNIIYVEFEKIYKKLFFLGDEHGNAKKKRYAGTIFWKDGKILDHVMMDIKGFDAARSDSPTFIRDLQRQVLLDILNDIPRAEVVNKIRVIRDKILNGEYTGTELGIPKGMSKLPHEYTKNIGAHVRGVIYSNMYLGTNIKRDKVKYVYVSRSPSGYPETNVISFIDTMPEGFEPDYKKMEESLIHAKFVNIFSSMGWNMSELDGVTVVKGDAFW